MAEEESGENSIAIKIVLQLTWNWNEIAINMECDTE